MKSLERQNEILNILLTLAEEAQKGYREAAENVSRQPLKEIFLEYSEQRAGFQAILRKAILQLGGEVNTRTDAAIASSLHRTWIDIKAAVTANEDNAVLNEVLRGEKFTLESYQEALDELELGNPYYSNLQSQHAAVVASINRMRNLELFTQEL